MSKRVDFINYRVFKRVPVNIEAEIISCSMSYPAFIINISKYGIYVKIANLEPVISSISESNVDLRFRLPSGEAINLICRKKWAHKNTSNSFIENVGIEILDPPDAYSNFLRAMSYNGPADC